MTKPKKSKRFHYSLATLLKVRGIREDQEKEKFKEAERLLLEEQKKEAEIKAFEQKKYDELKNMMAEGVALPDVQQIMMRKVHLERVHEQVVSQEQATQEADRQKEVQRETMVRAMVEKKIIDKDKGKTRVAWRKMMDKVDGKFLDDIAIVGYENRARKKREEEGVE